MGSLSGIQPVQTTSQAPVRISAPQERQVARTELPEASAVTAAANVVEIRRKDENQPKIAIEDKPNVAEQLERTKRVERDAATKELVFRTVSAETGRVISQYPDEAALRERAYRANQQREDILQLQRVSGDERKEQAATERQA